MSTITPHLWFDTQALDAATFYVGLFPDSEITSKGMLEDTPSGDAQMVSFRLWGQDFMAISAGPQFTLNPSISFIVNVDPSRVTDAAAEVDRLWSALSEGGHTLMELGEYPFSARYGWVQDRFGVSWQIMLTNPDGEPRPPILPALLFVGDAAGRAEEARDLYTGLFPDAETGALVRWPEGAGSERPGTVMFSDFRLGDTWLTAMDSSDAGHGFGFNEAISFVISCADQSELDRYWEALSSVPEAEQCGWCKDRFGVSWQIIPAGFERYMSQGTPEQTQRVVAAFMGMGKMDIAALEAAYHGE